jgi:hypothetical protein
MRRTEALQGGVFWNLLHHWEYAELNQEEAAEPRGPREDVSMLDAPLRRGGRRRPWVKA